MIHTWWQRQTVVVLQHVFRPEPLTVRRPVFDDDVVAAEVGEEEARERIPGRHAAPPPGVGGHWSWLPCHYFIRLSIADKNIMAVQAASATAEPAGQLTPRFGHVKRLHFGQGIACEFSS